jgi:DNA-binding SARP family transcriptional activator
MQVRLLGPVDVTVAGEPRPVHGVRRKAVLAVLALHQGDIVPTDQLVDAVWGDTAPPTAANTLQSHLSHLRQVLGDRSTIVARPPGYLLTVPTDLQAAERLIDGAAQATTVPVRAQRLRAALDLWRGQVLQDVGTQPWLAEQASRLEALRVRTIQQLIEARLELGEHATLVPALERLVEERRFDEQLHAQLMLALYRAGRQADALAVYQRLKEALDEELGIDPGPFVRAREAAILRQDRALDHRPLPGEPGDAEPVRPGRPGPGEHAPRQLPPAVAAFAGRERELAQLDALLVPPDTSSGMPAVVISAMSGTAGVGKTALAVHWAHRVADRFPDGQLYANLRGFDPSGVALEPAAVLRGFLEALDVPVERLPAEPGAQAALYRSLLAGRRMLVVLDNARDASQVRPLLPGAPGCLVLITSRNQLTPLVAAEGAHPLLLDLLSDAEAADLLARRLGSARVQAEPGAVAQVIERCARLPLALAVVAARAAHRPGFSLALLADGLHAAAGGLDALDGGDAASDVRAVFSWSYAALDDDAARVFRLLGLHPGPELSLAAAASLAGLPVADTRRLLTELAGAHLISEPAPGRYTCHDLLRAYAAELVHDDDRQAALTRMLDHYLHTADVAASTLYPNRDRLTLAPPPAAAGVTLVPPADRDSALEWFSTQVPLLLTCVDVAAAAGLDTHAWQLAWCLVSPLDGQGRWAETITSQQAGLAAATRAGYRPAQADAHRRLAGAYLRLGQVDPSYTHAQAALALCRELGDASAQAHSEYFAAIVCSAQGDHHQALKHSLAALELYRLTGYRQGEAQALNAVGWYHGQLEDYEQTLLYCTEALRLHSEIGDSTTEGDTLDSLGFAHHHLGQYAQAVTRYEQALAIHRHFRERYQEGDTLIHLGDSQHGGGDTTAARASWDAALAIFTELGHHDATRAQTRLDSLD